MKAYILKQYGSPDLMKLAEVPLPVIKDDQLLVQMLYTSLNAADLDYVHGHPLVRFTGLKKPGYPILGSDLVGRVEQVGANVKNFRIGNIVWADLSNPLNYGTFAEYVTVPASRVQKLPAGINLEDAACLPSAAMVALQNIDTEGGPKEGHGVLVNGAGGGIGTMAVQLLKARGARVTAVDKGMKLPLLREIGADEVIDYEKEKYCDRERDYDFIYDLVCRDSLGPCLKVLKKNGRFIMLGGSTGNILKVFILGGPLSLLWGRKIKMGRWDVNNQADLGRLGRLYLEGKIKPVIAQTIPFKELIKGLEALEAGNVLGKIVIKF